MMKTSKLIYESRNIETTDAFIGLGMMGPFFQPKKLEKYLGSILKNIDKNHSFSLELMSHAGCCFIKFLVKIYAFVYRICLKRLGG